MVFSLDWLRYCVWYYRFGFSAAFSVLLGLNFIVVEAAICTGSPVRGLRPVRAWRCDVENEPKPGHDTLSPLFAASTTRSTNAEMTASACADETPVFAATAARRSAFVIWYFLAFSESEFRDHQSERIRRRIASISRGTSRERRTRHAIRDDRRKTPIFPSRIRNSSDFFAHPHGEARTARSQNDSSGVQIVNKDGYFR